MRNDIRLSKEWTTHIPMLIKCVENNKKDIVGKWGIYKRDVLELGAGLYSTPLLHWLCAEKRRALVTYESNPQWYRFARKFLSRNHRVRHVMNWDHIDFTPSHERWGTALIDHKPERRVKDILRLKDITTYLVIHDSHNEREYGYNDQLWKQFKHVYHWKFCRPFTTVLSNFRKIPV